MMTRIERKDPSDAEALALGQRIMATQALCQLIGAQMDSWTTAMVEISVPLRDDLLQQHGYAHGGLLMFLADTAVTFAAGRLLGGDVLTSEVKINFIRPGKGDHLIAQGYPIGGGTRHATGRCEIFARRGDRETLVAAAMGSAVLVI